MGSFVGVGESESLYLDSGSTLILTYTLVNWYGGRPKPPGPKSAAKPEGGISVWLILLLLAVLGGAGWFGYKKYKEKQEQSEEDALDELALDGFDDEAVNS